MTKCLNCGKKHCQFSAFCKPQCAYIWGLINVQQGRWTAVARRDR